MAQLTATAGRFHEDHVRMMNLTFEDLVRTEDAIMYFELIYKGSVLVLDHVMTIRLKITDKEPVWN
jgi:hypothetical protein